MIGISPAAPGKEFRSAEKYAADRLIGDSIDQGSRHFPPGMPLARTSSTHSANASKSHTSKGYIMSMVGGLGGSLSSLMQQWRQNLFDKIDANGNGSVSQSELDQAVTSAGGTTAAANALFGDLDPSDTGSVSEPQFAQNLPLPAFGAEMGSQLIAAQAQNTAGSSGSGPASAFANQLFSQITNGGSTLTQSALEQAVTSAGGTTASADALYAQLDPNNTGSVTEQQFAANLPSIFNTATPSTGDSGNSAADAMAALMKGVASSSDATSGPHGHHGHHHHHVDTASATDPNGSSDSDPDLSPADQLLSQLTSGSGTQAQSLDNSSTPSAASTGNSAQDALFDLSQANGSAGSTANTLPSSPFGHVSQQMLSLMVQMQAQNQLI
jgi:Ca2+-binding EF-hand superfamily protein